MRARARFHNLLFTTNHQPTASANPATHCANSLVFKCFVSACARPCGLRVPVRHTCELARWHADINYTRLCGWAARSRSTPRRDLLHRVSVHVCAWVRATGSRKFLKLFAVDIYMLLNFDRIYSVMAAGPLMAHRAGTRSHKNTHTHMHTCTYYFHRFGGVARERAL